MAIDLNQLIAAYNPSQYGYARNTDGSKPNGWYLNGAENPSDPYGGGTAFDNYLTQHGVGMWDPGNPVWGRVGVTNKQAFDYLNPGAQILGQGGISNGQFDPNGGQMQFYTGGGPARGTALANRDYGDNTGINKLVSTIGPAIPLALATAGAGGFLGGAGGAMDLGGGLTLDEFGNVGGGLFQGGNIAASDGLGVLGDSSWGVNSRDLANPFTSPDIGEEYNQAVNVGNGGSALDPTGGGFPNIPGASQLMTDGSTPSTKGSGLPMGASSVGTSALAKLLGISDSTAQLIGAGGTTLAGILGANKQSDTLKSIFDQQRSDRAPALAAYNSALSNPDTFYQTAPAMGAADAAARALSVKGNPAWNPTLSAQLTANNLGGYNSYLNNLAGPAFGGQSSQAQLGTAIAGTQGSQANAVAGGLGNVTTPTSDLQALLKQFGGLASAAGSLNFGGNA